MSLDIQFLGAAGTVTGSRYLLTTGTAKVLVDCGLFQGYKQLRLRNREPFPIDPAALDAVVLTHAHLDHSGYLPLLIRNGFRGRVHCTAATRELCGILLPDSGHLQEEEANFANRHGYSKHRPALPLYTRADAEAAMDSFEAVPFQKPAQVADDVTATFHHAGHLLGAAMVVLEVRGTRILFSGDLGRPEDPLLPAPSNPERIDYLVVESTYGDRRHSTRSPLDHLAEVVTNTAKRGGCVLVPSFAVGRAQHLLYLVHTLKSAGRIPDIPVFLDSPMASRATRVFIESEGDLRLSRDESRVVAGAARAVETVEESKAIGRMNYPRIIVSASGMLTGGRVLHHLKILGPDQRNTVLFAGYQAGGTRGAALLGGAQSVKIHGAYVPIRAETALLDNLSGHADYQEILNWLGRFDRAPRRTFITHGEPAAADALRLRIEEGPGWRARVPEHLERAVLG